MSTHPGPIAIIGGGPCGLTLARLLERKGIDYTVYERDASPTDPTNLRSGGSLDLHPETGQRALREAGLWDAFKQHARWGGAMTYRIADKDGKMWLELNSEGSGERDAPEIDRVDLRKILVKSIPPEKIRWGYAATEARVGENGGMIVKFGNGETVQGARLVVGADGTWSKLRPLITSSKPQYSGKLFIESRVNPDNSVYDKVATKVGPGSMMCLAHDKQIIMQRQGDDSYRIYLGITSHADLASSGKIDLSDPKTTFDYFLSQPEYFSDWADELKELVRDSTDCRIWPLYYMPPETLGSTWKACPGVTLAGDAAHVTVPFAGEGVNCAMNDALVLAEKIEEYGTEADGLNRAVREYEQDMLVRGKDLISRSLDNMRVLFDKDSPQTFLNAIQGGSFC